ncbi:nucleotidyltransferase domain-containing protein [Sulfolobus sp. S-194]|uniref:nucleotidyltransferase domain-containing protein n=1 Tax=Sulfolobus sp. S-194 TaxID=2512240 RepID=UPI001436E818|nr:nucleotidyltransferase domain-containing protein [Sulfolobus sp. S-194]QIW23611.1 nucleotidyltransferase domain-containing protein [Sulfolobus sp. S-194]
MSFDEFIKRVIEYYNGKVSIVLFGSRARGDYWESSDYDIVVFLESVRDPIDEAVKLYSMKKGFPADIVVLNIDKLKDPIIMKMLEHKKVIYDGLKLFTI